ncbi:MAG: hypothetical protein LUQ50_10350 [Methanospirillum sp.]|uniref:hypothetical protein n=1 Tax=Methanospirillum sp. TaxID=45200 RepID=UPI002375D33D|nr:hypothetical protein [Methanospirillum sp.]MDD1729459.1 hypothetical protein [Methanospirillum sp.]
MKIACAILIIILGVLGFSVLATAAETKATTPDSIPNLTGTWKGTSSGYMVGTGFTEDTMTYTITEQNGQAFIGFKEYFFKGQELGIENFAGIITDEGTIYIVDIPGGQVVGKLIGSDQMNLNSFNDGEETYVFISILKRETH